MNHLDGPTTAPDRANPGPSEAEHLDLIACDGCGRSFVTADGPAMMAVIKGPCPTCGGRFQLEGAEGQASGA